MRQVLNGQEETKGLLQVTDLLNRVVSSMSRKLLAVGALFIALITTSLQAHAYEAGKCEFDSHEDAANAINDAMMKNPSKWKGAVDTNGNGVADALESWNHSLSGGTMFGNYMCSEFAALALCVLKQEYNCTDEDVKMVVGPAVGGGGLHAVTGLREGVIKNPSHGAVDGFHQLDFSWPDWANVHIPNPTNPGRILIRDGIFNVGPQECADGFAVMQGSGMAGGAFGSGGASNMMQQMLLSAMMNQLMSRMSQQNSRRTSGMQKLYDAMQKRIREEERLRVEAEQTAQAQESATAAAEQVVQATPTAAPTATPIPTVEPTAVSDVSIAETDASRAPDLSTSTTTSEAGQSDRASLAGSALGSEIQLPPDPAVR